MSQKYFMTYQNKKISIDSVSFLGKRQDSFFGRISGFAEWWKEWIKYCEDETRSDLRIYGGRRRRRDRDIIVKNSFCPLLMDVECYFYSFVGFSWLPASTYSIIIHIFFSLALSSFRFWATTFCSVQIPHSA